MRPGLQLAVLGFAGFVTSFGAHVVAVTLPAYATQVGAGTLFIGLLIAVYDLAEVGAKPVFGVVADRRGLKVTLLAGIVLFSLASLSFLALPPQLLLLVRFVQGLGAAALSISSAALVAELFPEGRGRAFGIYNAIKGAGYVLSPIIGGAILWSSSLSMVFVTCFAVGCVAFVLCLGLPEDQREGTEFGNDDDDLGLPALWAALSDRVLRPWYAVIIINMCLVGILFGFVPVYTYSLGYNPLESGLTVAAATTSYLLIQPLAGSLADRADPLRVMMAGLILSSAAIALIPFTRGAPLTILCAIGGVGVGTVWTNSDAMVSTLAAKGRTASALGAAGSFKEIGDMLGPATVGAIAQLFGLPASFLACGALGLLCAVVLARTSLGWTPHEKDRG